jgi:coenzyme F420-reducing hydrogenase beta subunit
VVANDLCIGCGICAGILPKALYMQENEYGAYYPEMIHNVGNDWEEISLKVCPFSGDNDNEDEISRDLFNQQKEIRRRNIVGYYLECFTGYVRDENKRIASTSGGLITWLAEEMLSSGKVDAVACVGRSNENESLFTYQLIRNPSDLYKCKKSRYYPVEFSNIIQEIKKSDDKILFIGLPCFIKAVRLATKVDPVLAERISYTVGLFCGHLKSKHYSAYLARSCGVHEKDIQTVDFRKKIEGMPSSRYAFEVVTRNKDTSHSKQIMMQDVFAGSWSNNLFMLDACECCDDIMAETADIAVGDAWLPEYTKDYRGTSIVICRNEKMLSVLQEGIEKQDVLLQKVSVEKVIKSQSGGIRQRRTGLQYRLYLSAKKGQWHPAKRVMPDPKAGSFLFRLLQLLRIKTKLLSRQAFLEQQTIEGLDLFVRKLKLWIFLSDRINSMRHFISLIKRKYILVCRKIIHININKQFQKIVAKIKR